MPDVDDDSKRRKRIRRFCPSRLRVRRRCKLFCRRLGFSAICFRQVLAPRSNLPGQCRARNDTI
jgi:hypothetical protein